MNTLIIANLKYKLLDSIYLYPSTTQPPYSKTYLVDDKVVFCVQGSTDDQLKFDTIIR